jgi:glycosyltransferase involved in cell wall biosynthesis
MRLSYRIDYARRRDLRVRVVGHPFAPIGMGEHVRSAWRSLNEVGVEAKIVDIYGPQGQPDPELVARCSSALTPLLGDGVNVYCINGDEIEQSLSALPNPMTPGSKNVIYPLWELERYPEEWAKQLMRFDEVWAPSAFIRDSVAKAVSIPVLHMPLASEVTRRALRSRRHFGIRESAYTFFFSFDFLSYVERKNPFALIEAFNALSNERPFDDIALVIKTNNADRRPEMKARFDAAIAPLRDRVTVINGTLSEPEIKSLLWLTDCFVSLHRSEGFGYGMSEAMALGKPVIATAYSGNMDFCSEETAFLVPYRLIGVRPGEYPHWRMQHWADPDVEVATKIMRDLIDDPKKGRDKGARARLRLMTDFSYLATGLRYQRRIDELMQMETRKPEPIPQNIARPRRKKNSARRNAVEH